MWVQPGAALGGVHAIHATCFWIRFAPLTVHSLGAPVQEGTAVILPGEGVSVRAARGRPDISTYLTAVAEESGLPTVGVFAGGPSGLMQNVHLAVAGLNSRKGGAHFELHNESVEL